MLKRQAGFTLIELVMVIVILGILAAFALPRFADLTGDARAASISGLAGALKSAAAIAHAEFIVEGSDDASVTLDGTTVALASGYPTIAGIIDAASVDTANDYTSTPAAAATPPTVTFTINGQTAGNNCEVIYTEATATTSYSVALDNGSC